MFTYVRVRRGRWLALVLCILGLTAVGQAQIQLRGPPLNQRPSNQQTTITDPITGVTNTFIIPQHVQLMPGKDGLLHISQIAKERVNQVSDYVKEGQPVRVKVIEADDKGRVRLSMKAAAEEDAAKHAAPAAEPTPAT